MKMCKNCGSQMEDEAKFCRVCGTAAEESTDSPNAGYAAGADEYDTQILGQQTGSFYGQQDYSQQTGSSYGQQNYNQQPYGQSPYGQQPYMQPAKPKTCGFSIASLILGIVGIFLGVLGAGCWAAGALFPAVRILAILFFLPNILAIVFGIMGIRKASRQGFSGKGLAIAGLILGIIFLIIWFAYGCIAAQTVQYYSYYGMSELYNLFQMFE